jgi:hypothetical protein
VHLPIVDERVHRALAADEQRCVIVVDAHAGERLGLLDQLHVRGRVDEAEADQILGRVAGPVARIAEGVALQRTARRARDVDLVAVLGELQKRMRELGPPEANRPAGLLGDGRVRRHDHDPLQPFWIEDVHCCAQGLSVPSHIAEQHV